MAHRGQALALVFVSLAVAGCYEHHVRELPPPIAPVIDAAVVDVAVPRVDAFVCRDCSCCSCGRPSSGDLCPLIGLEECCIGRLEVEATISSATLGDDCAEEITEDCAGFDGCGCAQTSVQLRFVARGPTGRSGWIEIHAVRVFSDDRLVAELLPGELTAWRPDDTAYVPWDGRIVAGDDVRASVPTSAPDWTVIGGGVPGSTYGMEFRVHVIVSVDGEERELSIEPVIRQSDITT